MSDTNKKIGLFAMVAVLLVLTGITQSWNTALQILNMGLISAIMALGVNLQWGFAGLFNIGVMGFVALGGLATVLVAMPMTPGAWTGGGFRAVAGLALGAVTVPSVATSVPSRCRWSPLAATSATNSGAEKTKSCATKHRHRSKFTLFPRSIQPVMIICQYKSTNNHN